MFRTSRGKVNLFMKVTVLAMLQLFLLAQGTVGFGATPDKLIFNEKYGRVRESAKGAQDRMIIHIQDAHCVYEAQKNIIGLVKDFYKNHNVRLVAVEGADAYFDADELASFPISSVKKDVADYFLKNGRITGVEYMLVEDELPLAVRGAESRDLYIDNYNAYMECMPKDDDAVVKLIGSISDAYEALKPEMLNDQLMALDAQAQQYREGSLQFVDYSMYLIDLAKNMDVSLAGYENFAKLIEVRNQEENIDFAKILTESSNLIDELSGKVTKDQLTQLLNKNLFYKIGKISPYVFYSFLREVCRDAEVDMAAYPNVVAYTDYLALYQSIDDIQISQELATLEDAIEDGLASSSDQKELLALVHNVSILQKMISLKVSKSELNYYRENKDQFTEDRLVSFLLKHVPVYGVPFNFSADFSPIASRIPIVDKFYHIANKRNEALIENTIAEMDLEDSNIAILITGGFHTEGISDILKREDIAYHVVSPAITEAPVDNPYLARLSGVPTAVEEMLDSNRLQIPLVLADPSIIPESADRPGFLAAFKVLLNAHPDAQDLLRILDEGGADYEPAMTFLDSFALGQNRYVSFNLNGRNFFMQFTPGQIDQIPGAIQGRVGQVGQYSFAFIEQNTFLTAARDENRKLIDARSGLDSRIEVALARGDVIEVSERDQMEIDDLVARGLLTPQSSAEGVRPTMAYMVNSRVSALVVQPKTARVDAFSTALQDVLRAQGVQKVEVFSNLTDLTVNDAAAIDQNIARLLEANRLELPSGKIIRAVVRDGVAQVFAVTPEAPGMLRPQLVISDAVFTQMLPSVQQPSVNVVNAAQAERQGYIDINPNDRTVALYTVNEQGERAVAVDMGGQAIQVTLPPSITSVDILDAITQVRRQAAEQSIGLIGYGNFADGVGISFTNLGAIFQEMLDSDLVTAFTNVYKLISQIPSLQDVDLSGISNATQLKEYFLQFTDGEHSDEVNCAVAAAAAMLGDSRAVTIKDQAFDIPALDRGQVFARVLPLIDQRVRGQIALNADQKAEYSMFSIAKAYELFGYNSQALYVTQANLPALLEELPVGETVVVHVVADGKGHYVALRKDVDGYFVYDLKYGATLEAQDIRNVPKQGIAEIFNGFAEQGYQFDNRVLVGQYYDGTDAAITKVIAANQARPLDIDEQLECLGACGTTALFPIHMGTDYNTVLNLALRSLLRIDYRGSDSHSIQATFKKAMVLPEEIAGEDNPPTERTVVRTFKAAYNTITQKIEFIVKEVVDDKYIYYLKRQTNGDIAVIIPPSSEALAARGMTLPEWEQKGEAITQYTGFQVSEIFGDNIESTKFVDEEIINADGSRGTVRLLVGPYGKQIKGLKPTNIKSYMPQLMDRFVKTYTQDFDPSVKMYNVTGQVRWATHGPSNVVGAHPHTVGPNDVKYATDAGTVSVVHNGVFYNYDKHRKDLLAEGHVFKSPVDTEVFAHLIFRRIHSYKYNNSGQLPATIQVDGKDVPLTLQYIVTEVLKQLEYDEQPPTYSLQVTSTDFPGEVVTGKRVSPVYLAISDGRYEDGGFVQYASDPKATIHGSERYSGLLDDGIIFNTTEDGIHGVRIVRDVVEQGGKKKVVVTEQPTVIVLEDGTVTDGAFTERGKIEFKPISIIIKNKETGEEYTVSNVNDIVTKLVEVTEEKDGKAEKIEKHVIAYANEVDLQEFGGQLLTGKKLEDIVKPKGEYNDGQYFVTDLQGNELAFTYIRIGRDRPEIFERGMFETFTEKELSESGVGILKTIKGNTTEIPVLYVNSADILEDAEEYTAVRLANIINGYTGETGEYQIALTEEQRIHLMDGLSVSITVGDQQYFVSPIVERGDMPAHPDMLYLDRNSGDIMSLAEYFAGFAGAKVRFTNDEHKLTAAEKVEILSGTPVTKTINGRSYTIAAKPAAAELAELTRGKVDFISGVDFKTEIDGELQPNLSISEEQLKGVNKIVLLSTGSSFNADLASVELFRSKGIDVRVVQNDDLRDEGEPFLDSLVTSPDDKILVVLTSQSGTTQSAVLNAEMISKYNQDQNSLGYNKFLLLADTNTPGSMITDKTDGQINEHTGPEIAVASQKAVHAQMTNKFLLALLMRRIKGDVDPVMENIIIQQRLDMAQGLISLLDLENTAIDNKIDEWAARIARLRAMFVVHRGAMGTQAAATETVLKFQELARIFGIPIQAGLFLHGPVALVESIPRTQQITTDPVVVWSKETQQLVASANIQRVGDDTVNTPILAFYMPHPDPERDTDIRGRFESNLQSLKARGAKIYLVSTQEYGEDLMSRGYVEDYLPIDSIHDAVAVGQRLAVRIAKHKVKQVADPLLKHARDVEAVMVNMQDPSELANRRTNLQGLEKELQNLMKTIVVLRDTDELADLPNVSAIAIIEHLASQTYAYIEQMLGGNLENFDRDYDNLQLLINDLNNNVVTLARAIDIDRPKDLAKSVTVENRYSQATVDALQRALKLFNLENDDVLDILRLGPYELDESGFIYARPTRMLDLVAQVQQTEVNNVTNEGIYHELIEAALANAQFSDVPSAVLDGLSDDSRMFIQDRFSEFFYGGFTSVSDMTREAIAKIFTNKLIQDQTSEFFRSEEGIALTQEIDQLVQHVRPELYAIINPVGDQPSTNIDRVIAALGNIGVDVEGLRNVLTDQVESDYINTLMNAEFMAAVTQLNLPDGTNIEALQSERMKEDVRVAQQRLYRDLSVIPNITAMNVDFFVTPGVEKHLRNETLVEGEGFATTNTLGLARKIVEYQSNPKNLFVIYSMGRDYAEIQQILALHGISEEMVLIVGNNSFERVLAENALTGTVDLNSPAAITMLPVVVQNVLVKIADSSRGDALPQLPTIAEIARRLGDLQLEMMDFTIIDANPDVVDIAMNNLASAIDSPQGFAPQDLNVGDQISVGIDAFELAEMLEKGESLPAELLITGVSTKNLYIQQAVERIKAQHVSEGTSEDVTLGDLRAFLGVSRLNKEDLRGIKLRRQFKISERFIQELQSQRALDISA